MANYIATARSNYFRVKDSAAFQMWCEERRLSCWQKEDHWAIQPKDHSGWPNVTATTDEEFDLLEELHGHLQEECVAILLEVGSERTRYLCGYANAVRGGKDFELLHLSLDDIYAQAEEAWGKDLTHATY